MKREKTMNKGDPFLGRWRIVKMELWERADFDSVEPAHFTFEKNGLGDFCFNDAAGTRANARRTDSGGSHNPGGGPRR